MNLREQVLKENSRKNWEKVVHYIGKDPAKFAELMKLVFSKEQRVAQLASQVMTTVADFEPGLLNPYRAKLIDNLRNTVNDSVRRNTVRVFQFIDVPAESEGDLFDIGISFLKSAEESIAVKAFAMTALRRICEKYPELASELIPHIQLLVEEKASSGLVNRGQKELRKLQKLLNQ